MTDRLADIGSARRFVHADGELWVLPASSDRAAKRLVELGLAGVGGFIAAESGLVRRGGPDLESWLAEHSGPVDWRLAVAMLASLADAARACEQASLFPGAITTDQLVVHGETVELRADSLVHAMVGAPSVEAAAPKWMPADAIRPDNASNRYAIGLVAYRLVTGEHPFAGRGLRLGLDDQAVRGAPPFSSQIAATLPPGLQSLCLRMLSPEPTERPTTSAAIATALRDLLRTQPAPAGPKTTSRASAETPNVRTHRSDSAITSRVPAETSDARTAGPSDGAMPSRVSADVSVARTASQSDGASASGVSTETSNVRTVRSDGAITSRVSVETSSRAISPVGQTGDVASHVAAEAASGAASATVGAGASASRVPAETSDARIAVAAVRSDGAIASRVSVETSDAQTAVRCDGAITSLLAPQTSAPRTAVRSGAITSRISANTSSGAATAAGQTGDVTSRVSMVAAAAADGSRAQRTPSRPIPRRRWLGAIVALVPIAAGIVIAAWAVGASGSTTATHPIVEPTSPLASARELADCASCHPRQAAEWSRSVMAHSVESPLFGSLEMLIEEQVGRDRRCPDGAGALRESGTDPCTDQRTGIPITGSGGPGWCINCHAPSENLSAAVPPWDGHGDARSRRPLRDVLSRASMEGISCAACHQMTGPVHPGTRYQGNPSWTSTETGTIFTQRPEDQRGVFGIGNSGYLIDPRALISAGPIVAGGAHRRLDDAARAYRHSSEFCGACHDVRLFGTDAISGEHFKRLRNAYSEWATWATDERRAGRSPASCQDCHMSLYPAVCAPSPGALAAGGCPAGTKAERRAPGSMPSGRAAAGSSIGSISTHYFSGVDVPLSRIFDPAAIDDHSVDVAGIPVGARERRDLLLASAMTLAIDAPRRDGTHLEIPIVVDNVGAGHRVPAGFSQEREIWVHLRVTDSRGRLVYEAGRIDRPDEDLRDKLFLRVTTSDALRDRQGRSLGMFGADVADGPDVPRWSPFGGDGVFRGRGLVNFQNGFLRCVSCIGTIDEHGQCQAAPGQGTHRADRYTDGFYDPDTGECRSNLHGTQAFLETYFPVGSLDATRGFLKGPDAIIDTRSLAPNKPARYIYDLDAPGTVGPLTVEATLEFRAFPPYLIRAFIDYEAAQARAGLRPSGPLVERAVLDKLDIVHVATTRTVIP